MEVIQLTRGTLEKASGEKNGPANRPTVFFYFCCFSRKVLQPKEGAFFRRPTPSPVKFARSMEVGCLHPIEICTNKVLFYFSGLFNYSFACVKYLIVRAVCCGTWVPYVLEITGFS